MNDLERIIAYLAAHPDARAWPEEVLIRGRPTDAPGMGGRVAGAHFSIGLAEPDPTGRPRSTVLGPYPAALAGDDAPGRTPLAAVVGLVTITQQRTIDLQAAELAAANAALAAARADADAKAQRIEELERQAAALAAGGEA